MKLSNSSVSSYLLRTATPFKELSQALYLLKENQKLSNQLNTVETKKQLFGRNQNFTTLLFVLNF